MIVDSLELRVAAAEQVVVGTVVEGQVLPYPTGGGWRWTLARLAVEETLRGRQAKDVWVLVRWRTTAGAWNALGTRVLAFLLPCPESEDPPKSAPADASVAAEGACLISDPGQGAIPLSSNTPPIVTRDFDVLRDQGAIVAAARAAAKAAEPGRARGVRIDADFESDAWKLLYSGSAVLVRVPLDAPIIAQARAWVRSKDVLERVRAAEILGLVPGEDVDALLKDLLDDPATWTQSGLDGRRDRLYPVRRAARDALTARGVEVDDVVVSEPLPPDE